MFTTGPADAAPGDCPQGSFLICHHFQNAEHPNYVSSGWGVLHYVLNSVLDYLGLYQTVSMATKGGWFSAITGGMVLVQGWVAVLM